MPNNNDISGVSQFLQQVYIDEQLFGGQQFVTGVSDVTGIQSGVVTVSSNQNFWSQPIVLHPAEPQTQAAAIPVMGNDRPDPVALARMPIDELLEIFNGSPKPKRDECYPRRVKFKTNRKVRLIDPDKVYELAGYKIYNGDIGTIVETFRVNNKQFEVKVKFNNKDIYMMDNYLRLIYEDKKPAWF